MSNKTTDEKQYRGYSINNGKKRDFSCYTKTLEQVVNVTEYMVSHHSKTLFVRLDVRNDAESERILGRKDMTRIIENVERSIERKYQDPNSPDVNVVWTTENESTIPHFHLYFAVNGNAIQNGYTLLHEMNEAVKKRLGSDNNGLVEFCNSNGKVGIMVNRQSENLHSDIEKAVYAGSYLAKTRSKENRQKGARVSSASRLPSGWRDSVKYHEIVGNGASTGDLGDINDTSLNEIYKDDDFTCMHPPVDEFITFDE